MLDRKRLNLGLNFSNCNGHNYWKVAQRNIQHLGKINNEVSEIMQTNPKNRPKIGFASL